jgi:ABC-type lipoprotein export system ATPase subunit
MSSTPLIHLSGLVKSYPAPQPLRIMDLSVAASDRIVLSGLDEGAAEMFVHLVTGAAVPDEGAVTIAGRNTRDISTDTEWLTSLDQFGIVTRRAVLLDSLSVAANLALPLTLSIEPMPAEVRARAGRDAADVGLRADCVDGPVNALSERERLQLHLARAAANGPRLILLEHPTTALDQKTDSRRFGEIVRGLSEARGFGWIAITNDDEFAKGTRGQRLRLDQASGAIKLDGGSWLKRLMN